MDTLLTFEELQKSLNLKSLVINRDDLCGVLNILSCKIPNFICKSTPDYSYVYEENIFFGIRSKYITLSYIENYTYDKKIFYKLILDFVDNINKYYDDDSKFLSLIQEIENAIIDLTGLEREISFPLPLNREIKALTPDLKLVLGIETDYEFYDIILAKQSLISDAIAAL